jgi:IS30 family transposase
MLRERRLGVREIARRIGRAPSTVSRELRREKPGRFWEWDCWSRARHSYERRRIVRSFSRTRLRLKSPFLRGYVREQLELEVSPELISLRLKQQGSSERIGYQAIYNWIHKDCPELKKCLLRKGKRGTRGGKRKSKTFKDTKKRSIHSRSSVVELRARFGDWEGDTVVSSKSKACIFTLRERKSRFIRFVRLDDCTSASAYNAIIQCLQNLPTELRRTLTFDHGSENAKFKLVEERLKLLTYFCDPYASWQRGTVENGNGFLRRYFPKKTDFRFVTQKQLTNVENIHNNRPMKCLGGRTPNEVFQEQLKIKKAA